MKKEQVIAVVIVGIILLVVIILIARNLTSTSSSNIEGGTVTKTGGIGDFLTNIFGNLFSPKEPTPITKYCDCSKPGFTVNGAVDFNCRVGGLFYDKEC